jgi:type I restriction enzyme S subunit
MQDKIIDEVKFNKNAEVMENSLIQNLTYLKNLPIDWKVLPFDAVLIDVSGGNIKTQKSEFLKKGLIAVVDQGKELIAGYVNNKNTTVKTDSPHIVFGDHTRKLKYIDFPFAIGADGTKVLKIKTEVKALEIYIYYFFLTLNIPETGYNRHFKYLKECIIPLPPLPTQQKIAAILDKADELRQYNKQLIEKYEALTQSLFLDMFGDPVRNEKGWEIKKMEEISLKITDGTHQSPKFLQSGIPFLLVSNIVKNKINYKTTKFISNKDFETLNKRTPIEVGNILLTSVGSYGNPAIIESNTSFAFQRHIAFIKPNHSMIDYRFLFECLKSNSIKREIDKKVKGAAQKTYNLVELKNLKIITPPIKLQNQFAERVQMIEIQKQHALEALEKSEALFQGLLQQAFKGLLN